MGITPTTMLLHECKPLSQKQQTVPGFRAYKIVLRAMGFDIVSGDFSIELMAYFNAQIKDAMKKVAGAPNIAAAIDDLIKKDEIPNKTQIKEYCTILIPQSQIAYIDSLKVGYVSTDLLDDLCRNGAKLHSINDQPAHRDTQFEFFRGEVHETLEYCDMGPLCRDPNLGPAFIFMVNDVYASWSYFYKLQDGRKVRVEPSAVGEKRVQEAIAAQKAKQGVAPLLGTDLRQRQLKAMAALTAASVLRGMSRRQ